MDQSRRIIGRYIPPILFGLFAAALAWLSAGVSLLDDDWGHIRLCEKGLLHLLATSWTGLSGDGVYYRPVAAASLYLNFLVSGYAPALYHAINVFIHSGCGVLLYLLFRRLFPTAPARAAWAALLLFFVLPVHTDTVFWIVGRTDSLCALFYLGALLLFVRYVDRPSVPLLCGFGASFFLALYAKEMALALPGVLVVVALCGRAYRTAAARRALALSAVLVGVYLLTRQAVLGRVFAGGLRPAFSPSSWALQALRAGAMIGMTDFRPFGGMVLLLTGGYLVLRVPGVLRDALYLAGMAFVSLVPALGGVHRWYVYIPSAFVAMLIARVWTASPPRRRVDAWGLAVSFWVVIAYYGLVLAREGIFWREASALSEAFIRDLRPYVEEAPGTVYAVNVPSAYTPPGSLGGKPLFAFALKPALDIRSGGASGGCPVAVNHLWLLNRQAFRCRVTPLAPGRFRVAVQEGGFFSFHGPEARFLYAGDGRTVLGGTVDRPWGRLRVESRKAIEVEIDIAGGDRIVIYNEGRIRLLEPGDGSGSFPSHRHVK